MQHKSTGKLTLWEEPWPVKDKRWQSTRKQIPFPFLHHGLFLGSVSISSVQRHPAAAAKLLQSCPTLCNPIDSSPPGSAVPGILQARTLEWVRDTLHVIK